MSDKPIIKQFLKKNESEIIQIWQDELTLNLEKDHLDQEKIQKLNAQTKHLLPQIISLMDKETIPNFSLKTFEPILTLWHQLFKSNAEKGLSTKDMAMLIFSLKSSILHIAQNSASTDAKNYEADLDEIRYLLDFLGLLTFEIYSAEQESQIQRQKAIIQYLNDQQEPEFKHVIAKSPAMKQVLKTLNLVMDKDVTILLEGESGTGKDVIANLIHEQSDRASKPFIAINCGAIPRELMESELFGHEKGAFTGANDKQLGKFELAQDGTLFLDEIGEMPLDLQVKLLRVLQNKEIVRVGGKSPIPVKARIIAATNRTLKQLVDEEKFRLDLYYRLNVFPIQLPALKDRREDILPLALHFADKYAKEFSVSLPSFSEDAEHYLITHPWEGNIRELENLVHRAVILSQGNAISAELLALRPGQSPQTDSTLALPAGSAPQTLNLAELEKDTILKALEIHKHNFVKTSKALGISRTTLYNKLEKYGISAKQD